ncbi:MAG: phosphoribosyl-ATP diphosphatase [Clostridia bacterium]|nr:phosphoribosyl-ATP diphosphatase [Clostridia bacterium]
MNRGTKQMDFEQCKFDESGLLPVIAQDYESGEVLFLSKMNEVALKMTAETGFAHYVNADGEVYRFGAELDNTQEVKAAFTSGCGKTLLIKVKQKGYADPERKEFSKMSKQIFGEYNTIGGEMFGRLQRIISERRDNPEDGSYTSFLFYRGLDRIAKKVGEEAVELVIASKNADKQETVAETADLLYHLMILLELKEVDISEVCAELCKRNR